MQRLLHRVMVSTPFPSPGTLLLPLTTILDFLLPPHQHLPPPAFALPGFPAPLHPGGGLASEEDGGDSEPGMIESWKESIWNMAVPKRKTSYSRKRQRQMNPLYGRVNVEHFYPCPKCDKGFLKLRHHLCPCDAEKANLTGVKKVGLLGAVCAGWCVEWEGLGGRREGGRSALAPFCFCACCYSVCCAV